MPISDDETPEAFTHDWFGLEAYFTRTFVTFHFMNITNYTGEGIAKGELKIDHNMWWQVVKEKNFLSDTALFAFMDGIHLRCAYIDEFMSFKYGRGLPTSADPCYYWLGPNVEFDCMLFKRGILHQWEISPDKSNRKEYEPKEDIFVKMYGLGRHDLEFIQGHKIAAERNEMLTTIECFHALQVFLGPQEVSDVGKQLSFCSFAIRDARKAHGPPGTTDAERKALAEARRREFAIAKILVDSLWDDVRECPSPKMLRTLPRQDRGRPGDWRSLSETKQKELLGGNPSLIRRFVGERPNPSSRSRPAYQY
ncbi:hypothetical protein DL765_003437 [Monosporascus sp. GIB2]|nr:hypothetical protein DL765_003437 [Monosporascus sp. GIB2]